LNRGLHQHLLEQWCWSRHAQSIIPHFRPNGSQQKPWFAGYDRELSLVRSCHTQSILASNVLEEVAQKNREQAGCNHNFETRNSEEMVIPRRFANSLPDPGGLDPCAHAAKSNVTGSPFHRERISWFDARWPRISCPSGKYGGQG